MAKKVKAIASEVRVASVFAADGLTAQQAIADAVAHGVHNGRYALVAEAIQFGARRSANSKSALYAVWTALVEAHYSDNGVYDDETCGRALCAALKVAGLRGETPDSTAAKCRAWLAAAVKAENEKRKAEKERLAAEALRLAAERKAMLDEALRIEAELCLDEERKAAELEAAEALRVAVENEAAEIQRKAEADAAKVQHIAANMESMLAVAQAEPTKPKRGAVKKDSTKAASPRKPRASRKTA